MERGSKRKSGDAVASAKRVKVSEGSDSEQEEFDDGFDADCIGDEKDREYLESLPEIERENILSERFEARQRAKRLRELRRRVEEEQASAQQGSKSRRRSRKKAEQGEEEESKKPAEEETIPEDDEDELFAVESDSEEEEGKAAAAKASSAVAKEDEESDDDSGFGRRRLRRRKKRRPTPGYRGESAYFSDEDEDAVAAKDTSFIEEEEEEAEDASGSEFDGMGSDEEMEEEEEEVTLEDIQKAQVFRGHLERWIEEPFLKDVITNCFVRVFVGNSNSGRAVYKMCEVRDVVEGNRVYRFGNPPKATNLRLKVAFGIRETVDTVTSSGQHKHFRMDQVSNKRFTDADFQDWKRQMDEDGVDEIPTPSQIKQIVDRAEAIRKNYEYKHEDIDKMVETHRTKDLRGVQKLANLRINLQRRLATLQKELDRAKEEPSVPSFVGNAPSMRTEDDIEKELRKVAQDLEDVEEEAERRRSHHLSRTVDVIGIVNRKNLSRNIKNIHNPERKRDEDEGDPNNPFLRFRSQPRILWQMTDAESGARGEVKEVKEVEEESVGSKEKSAPSAAPASAKGTAKDPLHRADLDPLNLAPLDPSLAAAVETQPTPSPSSLPLSGFGSKPMTGSNGGSSGGSTTQAQAPAVRKGSKGPPPGAKRVSLSAFLRRMDAGGE